MFAYVVFMTWYVYSPREERKTFEIRFKSFWEGYSPPYNRQVNFPADETNVIERQFVGMSIGL